MPLGCRVPLCERVCLGSEKQQEENLQMRQSEHSAQRLSEILMAEQEEEDERMLAEGIIVYRSDSAVRRRSQNSSDNRSRRSRGLSGLNEIESSSGADSSSAPAVTGDPDVIVMPFRVLLQESDSSGPHTPLIPQDDEDHA